MAAMRDYIPARHEASTYIMSMVRSHSGLTLFVCHDSGMPEIQLLSSKTFFLLNYAYTNNVLNALVILMLACQCPCTPLTISLLEN